MKKERTEKMTKEEYEMMEPAEPDKQPSRCKPDKYLKPIQVPGIFFMPTGGPMHGYDMSHYQGNVDWDVIAKDPLAGYIYLKATESNRITDSKYDYNFRECKRVGLKVGSYHFFRGQIMPQQQFENFISVVDVKKQDLIPLVDVEIMPRRMSRSLFISRLKSFCDMVEKAFGCKPLIYTGKNFYERYLANTVMSSENYKYMIAAYIVDEPILVNGDDYLIWQFTSTGRTDGVRGKVDISRFRGGHQLDEILMVPNTENDK
ncbi:MAG: glycosyl hydrolase family 25 [Bacteroidaceae bacterium]|nr:glycosyl hydrolase family 25 [Bacteroidaceae bacterium]